MSGPRVVYVLKEFPKLSETFIANELAELTRRNVHLRILSLRESAAGVRHRIVDESKLVERTTYGPEAFGEVIRAFRPDLLHAHFATEATAAARDLAGCYRLPFTFTAHGYDIYRRPPADFAARAEAARAVVTVSQANARHIGAVFGVPDARLRVIPCGIDTEYFRPGIADGRVPLIVCVARLVPVKNHLLLLEACAILQARRREFRCVLVGEGRSAEDIAAARTRLGLDPVVEMAGVAEQSEVLRYWQRAAVGVLASNSEGMPVSLMEAASCGVPVVATAVGGVPELVLHGVSGLLVKPGDAQGLADSLERLLADRALAGRMALAARQRAEEEFSVIHHVERLMMAWQEVMDLGAIGGQRG